MASINLETLSAFGRLAVKLDLDFLELSRLSGQIQRLDIESDGGLDRAAKLLEQFAQQGKNISEGIKDFSQHLQNVREQSEIAAKSVAERSEDIRRRREEQNQIREKLNEVERNVVSANATLATFKKEGKTIFSDDEKTEIKTHLTRLNVDLKKFVEAAQSIRDAAGQSNFKSVERDAKSLLEALRASAKKIEKVISN